MHNRLRLLSVATAMLYLGPLLAGLGGFGWASVPVFALIFLLWLFILRPHEWPQAKAEWLRPEAWVALGAKAAVQLLLVVVSFGIGRGLGGVLGALPAIPVMVPYAVSFLAIPFGRLVWDPWQAAARDQFLDDAMQQADTPNDAGGPTAAAYAAVKPLLALPQGTSDDEALSRITAMLEDPALAANRLQALLEGLEAGAGRPLLRGLILWLTEPQVAERFRGQAFLRRAFAVIAYRTPAEASLLIDRASQLIATLPGLWPDFPQPQDLHVLIDHQSDPAARSAILALARTIERAAPGQVA